MENIENSLSCSYSVRYGEYWRSIEMKVKEVFFSTQAIIAVEILALLALAFAASKSIGMESFHLDATNLIWISLTIVHIIQNWKSIKTFFKENLG